MQPLIKFKCAEEHFQEGWAKMISQCCERLLVIKKILLKAIGVKGFSTVCGIRCGITDEFSQRVLRKLSLLYILLCLGCMLQAKSHHPHYLFLHAEEIEIKK